MRFKNIHEVFAYHGKDLKIDRQLAVDIRNYVNGFITKNENHVSFFSGVLVGVNKVVFTTSELNYFWDSLIGMDKREVTQDLYELRKPDGSATINKSFIVASDPTNTAFLWLCYKFKTSQLKETEINATIINLLTMLQIKFLTSLLSEYYPYPVDKELALATYNRLSGRFILRQFNSWREVLEYRANNIFNDPSREGNVKTNQVLNHFDHDQNILDMVTGIQTAIRRSLVEYNIVFYQVRDEEKRIVSTSQVSTLEGDNVLLDKISAVTTYRTYLYSILGSEKDFIKDEILLILTKNLGGVRYKPMYKILMFISDNYGAKKQDNIKEFVDNTLVYGLNFIAKNRLNPKDLITVFKRLQGGLSSSRSADPNLLRLRDLGDDIVKRVLGEKDYKSTISSLRTATMLYVIVRTITMQHYSK